MNFDDGIQGMNEVEGIRKRPSASSKTDKSWGKSQESSESNIESDEIYSDKQQDEHVNEEEEEEEEEKEIQSDSSPSKNHINHQSKNSSNEFDEEEDDDDYGDYGYDEFDYEYIPKIREPPSDEDSEDGLLVSKSVRDAALSGIAQALIDSAKTNQEAHDKEKQRVRPPTILDSVVNWYAGSRRLLRLEDMPVHLQFNKHVHSGYRHLQGSWGCFTSLFYVHNETVNILTHVAPIIYVLLFWRSMYPWEEIQGNSYLNVLGWSHVVASISPWTGSVFYHLFMNHQKGERLYQFLLQLDMFGIWVTECFGALTNLSAATWCLPRNLQTTIISAYGLASVWGLQKALTAWTPLARRMCFAPVFISRILAFVLRVSAWGGGESSVLIHVILQDVVSVAGGMIGVIRIPEKWFPGKLDIFINSHHIMHVLVVVAVIHMNLASNGDIRWIINNYSQAQCSIPL